MEPLVWKPLRRLPEASERLVAGHLPGRERHERLEDRCEAVSGLDHLHHLVTITLVVLQRHLVRVVAARRAAVALRELERALGRLRQRVRVAAVAREERVAGAEGDREAVELDIGDRIPCAQDHALGAVRVRLRQDQRELVADDAAEHIGGAQVRRQPLDERLQEQVTGMLAVRVVHALEVVQIEQHA